MMALLSQVMDAVPPWTGEPGARCFECGSLVIRGGVWVEGDVVFCVCHDCARRGAPRLMALLADALADGGAEDVLLSDVLRAMTKHLVDALAQPKPRAAFADAEGFADGDLDVVHGIAVPELLENGVGKAEHQNVLHRFLAEIMVNAKDLRLMRVARQLAVERLRGREIVAEWLLHDEPLPGAFAVFTVQQFSVVQLFDHRAELTRLRGQIE